MSTIITLVSNQNCPKAKCIVGQTLESVNEPYGNLLDKKYFVFLEPVECHKKKIELGLEIEGENALFKLSIISFF